MGIHVVLKPQHSHCEVQYHNKSMFLIAKYGINNKPDVARYGIQHRMPHTRYAHYRGSLLECQWDCSEESSVLYICMPFVLLIYVFDSINISIYLIIAGYFWNVDERRRDIS